MSEPFDITVKLPASHSPSSLPLSVASDTDVASIRQQIASKLDIENVSGIRLIYSGRLLHDGSSLSTYSVKAKSAIHCVLPQKAAPPASQSSTPTSAVSPLIPSSVTSTSSPAPTTTTTTTTPVPGADSGAPGANPLLQNPLFQSAMTSMFSNPQLLDSMISSNPFLAQMITPEHRALLQSPQMRQMMANPQFMNSIMNSGMMGMLWVLLS